MIKVFCIPVFSCRDGLQESAVISKTFTVDAPPDDFDDGYSFIESCDSMSTTTATSTTASSASTVKQQPRRNKNNKEQKHYHQVLSTIRFCIKKIQTCTHDS